VTHDVARRKGISACDWRGWSTASIPLAISTLLQQGSGPEETLTLPERRRRFPSWPVALISSDVMCTIPGAPRPKTLRPRSVRRTKDAGASRSRDL
jgi:hypothetical protein